jgi:alkanesulfonate monooxygenase SsuD/methylene tetrahydromethanopterin reductase-like flavin-dependent oxidoreductase (luciferase family)
MPVELIGNIFTRDQSETRGTRGAGAIDIDFTRRFTRACEEAGFDRVLVAQLSTMPDPLQVAAVGTPETVPAALLDYADIGVTTLLVGGCDPYDDAVGYGRHLIPLVRAEVAHRGRAAAAAQPVGARA